MLENTRCDQSRLPVVVSGCEVCLTVAFLCTMVIQILIAGAVSNDEPVRGRSASTGLPIGLQLMGKPWEEASLLYVTSVLESAVKPLLRMPAVSYDLLSSQH